MIAQNVHLDEYYHIIKKKYCHLSQKQPPFNFSNIHPATPKIRLHADRPILYQNAILVHCRLISHQKLQNKKKIAKIAQ